jgi:hypothetical protein
MRSATLAFATLFALVAPASVAHAANCAGTSTGMIPLTELGAGLYHGFPGGLYGVGSNVRPAAHEAAGVAIANSIVPLDTLGQPDPNGRIVFISIGMSNCTQEFSTFVPLANSDPLKHPRVRVIDCALGGQATQDIRQPNAPYWGFVAGRLRTMSSSPLQAQAVWLKEARRGPTGTFPASAESLTNDLGRIVQLIHDKLPNVKQVFLSSRIYAGYASTALNPEPYAYESGFAEKWLIEAQIAGVDSLEFDSNHGTVRAPWLSWGPYLWADGMTPRNDELIWQCSDFVDDGTHPSASGRTKVATMLLNFMKTDTATEPWFVSDITSVPSVGQGVALAVWPNPVRATVQARFFAPEGKAWRADLLDVNGRRVRELGRGVGVGGTRTEQWRVPEGLSGGLYWLRVFDGSSASIRRIAIVR